MIKAEPEREDEIVCGANRLALTAPGKGYWLKTEALRGWHGADGYEDSCRRCRGFGRDVGDIYRDRRRIQQYYDLFISSFDYSA
jgi:hypothetical protein